jgi:membrane-associated phospholipid phosphatase
MVAAGFYDVFRALYPDPVTNYGATFPMPGVMAQHPKPFLRLDYVYAAGKRLKSVSFEIIAGDYHRPFVWHGRSFSAFPSDHAAVLAYFVVDTRGKRLQRR